LLVNSSDGLNGSGMSLYQLVKTLNPKKYEVHLILPGRGQLYEIMRGYANIHIVSMRKIDRSLKGLVNYLFYYFKSVSTIVTIIVKYRFEIIHVNTVTNLYFGLAAKITRTPIIYHVREVPGFYPNALWNLYRWNIKFYAEELIACSKIVGELLNIKEIRINSIQNAVDEAYYSKYKKFKATIIIGTFANESNRKGLIYLLEAFVELLKLYPKLRMSVISSYPDRSNQRGKAIIDFIELHGIEGYIQFTGLTKDVPYEMSKIDMLVVPSLFEAYPRCVIEGLASSKPVIATDTGGTREIIINNETGILIDTGNPKSIIDSVHTLINDENLAKRISISGHKFVKYNNTSKIVTDAIESVYNRILLQRA
jgi:glycosyltransferase involved in cell wall biosynthesis